MRRSVEGFEPIYLTSFFYALYGGFSACFSLHSISYAPQTILKNRHKIAIKSFRKQIGSNPIGCASALPVNRKKSAKKERSDQVPFINRRCGAKAEAACRLCWAARRKTEGQRGILGGLSISFLFKLRGVRLRIFFTRCACVSQSLPSLRIAFRHAPLGLDRSRLGTAL